MVPAGSAVAPLIGIQAGRLRKPAIARIVVTFLTRRAKDLNMSTPFQLKNLHKNAHFQKVIPIILVAQDVLKTESRVIHSGFRLAKLAGCFALFILV